MVAPLKVGLAGLGTVGASVVRLIERQREALAARCGRDIEIVAVSARSRMKQRAADIGGLRWVVDPIALAADAEIDVFIELIGGAGEPAKGAVEAALAAGKSVVTANKALLACHGVALASLAEQHHVALNFEAAVAGGRCAAVQRSADNVVVRVGEDDTLGRHFGLAVNAQGVDRRRFVVLAHPAIKDEVG